MATDKANWLEIDPATLPEALAKAYQGYKEAYKLMKAEREAWEQAFAKAVAPTEGKRVVFGYNFGKLSVAVVEDDRPKAKPKAKTLSLSAFLAAQGAAGLSA